MLCPCNQSRWKIVNGQPAGELQVRDELRLKAGHVTAIKLGFPGWGAHDPCPLVICFYQAPGFFLTLGGVAVQKARV